MIQHTRFSLRWGMTAGVVAFLMALVVVVPRPVSAITQIPTPNPIPGSYGLEATKPKAPPTQGATITTPGAGASFAKSPIGVSGICPNDLLVQVYNNGVMVGAVMCVNGSFSLDVSLFAGANELTAIVYDELDQAGPTSNSVAVNYTDTSFQAFGQLITLTSSYGRRASSAGTELQWPLQLTGGSGPYAFSLDWGDSVSSELKSQSLAGLVTVAHTYKKAGVYSVNVKVADANGVSAFLRLTAVASGQVDTASTKTDTAAQGTASGEKILWLPAAIAVVLLIPTFWIGRLSQTVSIRNKMLRDRDRYKQ
jgi:hypothetical protein